MINIEETKDSFIVTLPWRVDDDLFMQYGPVWFTIIYIKKWI